MATNVPASLETALLVYAFGALAGLAFLRRGKIAAFLSFAGAIAGAAHGIVSAVMFLMEGPAAPAAAFQLFPSLLPYLQFSARMDALSAFFVLLISAVSLAISIFSLGYMRSMWDGAKAGILGAFYNLLLLATTLVAVADNAFFFLMAWEVMALMAYCLISFEHEKTEARNAGVLFFIMSHIGTGCLILGFLLLFQASGGYGFEGFHAIGDQMAAKDMGATRDLAFVLFLMGFGVKAGIVPLHIWLPAAHPVAPSNISAVMSGVIIKTGIYGLTRVLFDFLGAPPLWWGITVLVIGTASAVLGVLYALMEHDLKRLLAYHSIENIGIILMGLGASLIFLRTGHPMLASMALIAGMFHTLNHAIFKALLFLGAGAVLHATHTRDMERMGGLIKRMPATAFFFLIGAVAISALPPLNGFVSEWLTYQSLLQGFNATEHLARLVFPFGGALLALTGALAAACFVKAFGITFLAQPRSPRAEQAREAPPAMLAGMALLAALCILLGLCPKIIFTLLDPVTAQTIGQTIGARLAASNGLVINALRPDAGSVSMAGIALMAICLLPLPAALWLMFGRGAIARIGPTWDCGLRGLTPRMEYTATGFSKPIRMIFKTLFRPRREVQREYDLSPYFAKTIRFESHVEEIFQTRVYRPLNRLVLRASRRLRALQAGSLQAYLIYIFLTLLVLLLFAL